MTAAASESARKVASLSGEVDTGTDRTAASLRQIERKFTSLLSMIDKRSDDLTGTISHTPPSAPGAEAAAVVADAEPPAEHAPV
jgi:hypothetical protein